MPLIGRLVAARLPLTEEEWALVPTPCPGLGRALRAALAKSDAQAAKVVRRLEPADAERLRTFALCLARLQRCLEIPLPPAVARILLSRTF